jgi:hypothetical protein
MRQINGGLAAGDVVVRTELQGRKRCMRALGAFLVVSVMSTSFALADAEHTFYVAPDGRGTVFTEAQPGPLEKVQEKVRSLVPKMDGDIVVVLQEGTYALSAPLAFGPEDGGRNGHKVVYRAKGDKRPVLSGGKRLTGKWALHDEKKNIYRTEVEPGARFQQFYVNGERAWRAMGKRTGRAMMPASATWKKEGGAPWIQLGERDRGMANWRNADQIVLVYQPKPWRYNFIRAESIEAGKVTFPALAVKRLDKTQGFNRPKFWENAYELLDTGGEYYHDPRTGELFYVPREDEDLATAIVEVPVIERLIEIKGTREAKVGPIEFHGIDLMLSNWDMSNWPDFDDTGSFQPVQANLSYAGENGGHTPAAVHVWYGKGVRFEDCVFTKLGSQGINLLDGTQDSVIAHCTFTNISGTAIQIGRIEHKQDSPFAWPEDERDILKNCAVTDSTIKKVCTQYPGGVGILMGWPQAVRILHNEIAHLPYSGISLGWQWGKFDKDNPTCARNGRIEYNKIHDVGETYWTPAGSTTIRDGGCIYTLGRQDNTSVSYNDLCNAYNGLRLLYNDEGSAGFTLKENVCHGKAGMWLLWWTKSIHNCAAIGNFVQAGLRARNNGDRCRIEKIVTVKDENWPPRAREIMSKAGPRPRESEQKALAGLAPAEILTLIDLEGEAHINQRKKLVDHGESYGGPGRWPHVVGSPVRAGSKALKYTLGPQTRRVKNRIETHLQGTGHHEERWYGLSIYEPEGNPPVKATFMVLSQIFFQNQCSSPSMALTAKRLNDEDVYQIRHVTRANCDNVGAQYQAYNVPRPKGKWTDFVFHFKPSATGEGFFRAWVNGNQIADHTGTTAKKPRGGVTRIGIYRGAQDAEHVFYFDEIRIGGAGSSYDEVAPGSGVSLPGGNGDDDNGGGSSTGPITRDTITIDWDETGGSGQNFHGDNLEGASSAVTRPWPPGSSRHRARNPISYPFAAAGGSGDPRPATEPPGAAHSSTGAKDSEVASDRGPGGKPG